MSVEVRMWKFFISLYTKQITISTFALPCMPERDDIKKLQQRCYELDDELRWLLALISDTGLRLSEAVGLAILDIKLD